MAEDNTGSRTSTVLCYKGWDLVPGCNEVPQSGTSPWSKWLGGRLLHNTNPSSLL